MIRGFVPLSLWGLVLHEFAFLVPLFSSCYLLLVHGYPRKGMEHQQTTFRRRFAISLSSRILSIDHGMMRMGLH